MSKPKTLDAAQSTSRTAISATKRFSPLAYRIDDAAAVIGVSQSTVWGLIRSGRLPARKLDRSTVIRHEDLLTFVDSLPEARSDPNLAEVEPLPAPSRGLPSVPERVTNSRISKVAEPHKTSLRRPPEPPKGTDAIPKQPSPELAAIVGIGPMSRPEALAKIWDYIRAHGLQTPGDKRIIVCDDTFKAFAGQEKITMYGLFKLCRTHLTPV